MTFLGLRTDDYWTIATAILCGVACAIPGCFLVLRRMSLLGDAISHAILPGLVLAFVLTGSRAAVPMLIGAMLVGLLTALLSSVLNRWGKVPEDAAMGVVFTSLFAGGVLLLEQSDTSSVHLDVEHALFGNLESLIWLAAEDWSSLLDPEALAALPPELGRMALVATLLTALTLVFWRPLKISTFDPGFADTIGIRTGALGIGLVIAAAIAAVAAFDAVGSIIVIAMFICPPAAARLMTDRLEVQVLWSVAFAALSAVAGYVLAGYGPLWIGAENAVSAAGMIATVSGLILAAACLFGPHRTRSGAPREVGG
jgi:manganese/zinc/iron transport system permease protein